MTLDNDDLPVGRVLTRREVLVLLGIGASSKLLAACTSDSTGADEEVDGNITSCVVRPKLTEGPYYVDLRLNRSDIRSEAATGALRAGLPLTLGFAVSRVNGGACTPLANAVVDVWHCDALGVYSGVSDPTFGNTLGQTWLRGYQVTSSGGAANFTTVFPGWYQGRATHIHFNIRSSVSGSTSYDFTSQLFFPETLLTQIYTSQTPYTQKGDAGRLRNAQDGSYNQGGSQLVPNPTQSASGYSATVAIGLNF
jgi:protocatechuate 3,4-dioxygenase beta subunit